MKLIFSILFVVFAFQSQDYRQYINLPAKANYFTTDHLGNIYMVRGDQLVKYDNKGVFQYTFSDKVLGEINSVDVTNPMKIVLFYEGLSQVLFLDNMLGAQREPISLDQLGYPQAQLIAFSNNNGLWVYDPLSMELIRFNNDLQEDRKTGNISQITGIRMDPNFLVERNNWVYLNNPGTGIMVFDIFGTYSKTIPIKGLSDFQITENNLFYLKEGKYFRYNMKLLAEDTIPLPLTDFKQIRKEEDRFFFLLDNGFEAYKRTE